MDAEIRKLYTQYIRATLLNGDILKPLLGTKTPSEDVLNQYIEDEKDRLPEHKSLKGKGIQNILEGVTNTPNANTLNFISTLFEHIPHNLRQFNIKWQKKEITEKDLIIHTKFTSNEKTSHLEENLFIDFTDFVNERTKFFIGREKISNLFSEFQKKHDSGYFVLSGKPGMGKSAYLSSLVNKDNYIHHFINSDRNGKNSINDVLGNIFYRIDNKFELNLGNIENNKFNDGTFVKYCLKAVSEKLQRSEKCLIIVDGIDELKEFDLIKKENAINIFNLPRILPKGIFCILSIREIKDLPLKAMNEMYYELHPDSIENESDVREYIRVFIVKKGVQGFMKNNCLCESEFENLLYQKSEGNFMYLHCVLPQIEKGYYNDIKLEQIPVGLESYYEDHWERIKGKDEKSWFEYKLPIISMIALSEMSLPLEMIREYAKLPKTSIVLAVLEEWKQFFYEKKVGPVSLNIRLYKLYHRTFKEFLKRKSQVQAEQIDIRRFAKDFIIKYQKLYNSESQMEDFLEFHKKLKGDIRTE